MLPPTQQQVYLRDFALIAHLVYLQTQGFPLPDTLPTSLADSRIFRYVSDESSPPAFQSQPCFCALQDRATGRMIADSLVTPPQEAVEVDAKENRASDVVIRRMDELSRMRSPIRAYFVGEDLKRLSLFEHSALNTLRKIVCGNGIGKECTAFKLSRLSQLETLIVGEDSFTICERNDAHNAFALYDEMKTHPRTFSIVDCPRLVAVVIGNGSFASFTDCAIQRCPMLQNLQIGTPDKCDDYRNRSYAFFNCQTLVLKDLPGLEGVLLGNYAFYHCSSVVFYSGGGGVS